MKLAISLALLCFSCTVRQIPSDAKEMSTTQTIEQSALPMTAVVSQDVLKVDCVEALKILPGKEKDENIQRICEQVKHLPSCLSAEKRSIFHMEKLSELTAGERILVFALIHGDERPSGTVARQWMVRLLDIDPRNSWRIVPVLNPDGYKLNTRTNGRGVDINRNFPSHDWEELAIKYWHEKAQSHPRRYPGPHGASEPETLCAMEQIKDYKPDLIIAVHTPLGLLDFDGPKTKFPAYKDLPWRLLGTFPGSLGRYMWSDHKVPVMTVELKGNDLQSFDKFDSLQDASGELAKKLRTKMSRED